jgi:probable phosphoglycerate mutase
MRWMYARCVRWIRYVRSANFAYYAYQVRHARAIVYWYLRVGFRGLIAPRFRRDIAKWLMETTTPNTSDTPGQQQSQPEQHTAKPTRLLILVRHGQTTYNVEGRLPGQLPGVPLTDEGRRQAQRAAVALSGLPLSAIVASPLERARDTAEIIARGWALPVRLDPRLMDTDVGPWAGQKIDDLNKTDPRWKAFVAHPNEPPEGIEGFLAVQERTVAAVEAIRADAALGNYVVLVAHADVVKLILAYYTGMAAERAPSIMIGNASISVLAFPPEGEPNLLALNWSAFPNWLVPPAKTPAAMPQQPQQSTEPTEQSPQSPSGDTTPADAGGKVAVAADLPH